MSEYRIFETAEFARALEKLPADRARFIQSRLSEPVYPQLREMPYYGPHLRKLRNYSPPTWRYRIGPYRVFYHIDEGERVVCVLTVKRREDAYR